MSSRAGSVVLASLAVLVTVSTACAGSSERRPAATASAPTWSGMMPPSLAAPAGNELAFELRAEGVQIYSCARPAGGAAGVPAWAFQAPEATLTDPRGRSAGKHGAGPTWEALDGSIVQGAKVEASTVDASAIPWLLLRAASHAGGRGQMTDVTFVQRVDTSGGNAPAEGCSSETLGAVARVPYRAVYRFYRSSEYRADGRRAIPPLYGSAPSL
jgi:Protein of unknown function (DUF3455)